MFAMLRNGTWVQGDVARRWFFISLASSSIRVESADGPWFFAGVYKACRIVYSHDDRYGRHTLTTVPPGIHRWQLSWSSRFFARWIPLSPWEMEVLKHIRYLPVEGGYDELWLLVK
jgi:hypothetical protein